MKFYAIIFQIFLILLHFVKWLLMGRERLGAGDTFSLGHVCFFCIDVIRKIHPVLFLKWLVSERASSHRNHARDKTYK